MSRDDTGGSEPEVIPPGKAPSPGTNVVHLQLNNPTLNINVSNLEALQRIAEGNPDVALKIIEASSSAVQAETTKYAIGAVGAALVALAMIGGFVTTLVLAGTGAGLVFFIVCAAVAAIFSAVFTGKSQSLAWTVGFFKKGGEDESS